MKSGKSGGKGIPPFVQMRLKERVERYAKENLAGKYTRIEVTFRGAQAYIDLYTEPEEPFGDPEPGETREEYIERLRTAPTHLCRLGYLGSEEEWRFAFYTYAHDKYEPSFLLTGSPLGTPEEALATSTLWL
ncbi:MAG: hypothetical protein ACLQU1_11920 [Bryobacteraceae bacterium]